MDLVRSLSRFAWKDVIGRDIDEQDILRRSCMSKMLGGVNIGFSGFVWLGVTFVRRTVCGAC